ncbi:hypothetical protein SERLADRAFT_474810 [Serpula lacrymans var. lacrymans S7.9]|uniref:Uncharacterized protein n=1 Tax=Serpula lacrymans var. lacrymans (strain S7.9) TaxID=578457 RepID=F8P5F4_SERL9|nr:uncharacterized protein SERLADRAFT_474810 [Serpula lacrymans var. lacrymans S7.9]EGO21841.1 hypothetical protein SERLADRAFT_474810 [Serpula lacrymans var. lacrymans S7.9]
MTIVSSRAEAEVKRVDSSRFYRQTLSDYSFVVVDRDNVDLLTKEDYCGGTSTMEQ